MPSYNNIYKASDNKSQHCYYNNGNNNSIKKSKNSDLKSKKKSTKRLGTNTFNNKTTTQSSDCLSVLQQIAEQTIIDINNETNLYTQNSNSLTTNKRSETFVTEQTAFENNSENLINSLQLPSVLPTASNVNFGNSSTQQTQQVFDYNIFTKQLNSNNSNSNNISNSDDEQYKELLGISYSDVEQVFNMQFSSNNTDNSFDILKLSDFITQDTISENSLVSKGKPESVDKPISQSLLTTQYSDSNTFTKQILDKNNCVLQLTQDMLNTNSLIINNNREIQSVNSNIVKISSDKKPQCSTQKQIYSNLDTESYCSSNSLFGSEFKNCYVKTEQQIDSDLETTNKKPFYSIFYNTDSNSSDSDSSCCSEFKNYYIKAEQQISSSDSETQSNISKTSEQQTEIVYNAPQQQINSDLNIESCCSETQQNNNLETQSNISETSEVYNTPQQVINSNNSQNTQQQINNDLNIESCFSETQQSNISKTSEQQTEIVYNTPQVINSSNSQNTQQQINSNLNIESWYSKMQQNNNLETQSNIGKTSEQQTGNNLNIESCCSNTSEQQTKTNSKCQTVYEKMCMCEKAQYEIDYKKAVEEFLSVEKVQNYLPEKIVYSKISNKKANEIFTKKSSELYSENITTNKQQDELIKIMGKQVFARKFKPQMFDKNLGEDDNFILSQMRNYLHIIMDYRIKQASYAPILIPDFFRIKKDDSDFIVDYKIKSLKSAKVNYIAYTNFMKSVEDKEIQNMYSEFSPIDNDYMLKCLVTCPDKISNTDELQVFVFLPDNCFNKNMELKRTFSNLYLRPMFYEKMYSIDTFEFGCYKFLLNNKNTNSTIVTINDYTSRRQSTKHDNFTHNEVIRELTIFKERAYSRINKIQNTFLKENLEQKAKTESELKTLTSIKRKLHDSVYNNLSSGIKKSKINLKSKLKNTSAKRTLNKEIIKKIETQIIKLYSEQLKINKNIINEIIDCCELTDSEATQLNLKDNELMQFIKENIMVDIERCNIERNTNLMFPTYVITLLPLKYYLYLKDKQEITYRKTFMLENAKVKRYYCEYLVKTTGPQIAAAPNEAKIVVALTKNIDIVSSLNNNEIVLLINNNDDSNNSNGIYEHNKFIIR